MLKRRVKPNVLEGLIASLMAIVGIAVTYIMYAAFTADHQPDVFVLIVVIMLFQILAILGLTLVVLKVWEQHDLPGYTHKKKVKGEKK